MFDWSRFWDDRDKNRGKPIKYGSFIVGFILGGFTTITVMFLMDMIWLAMFG